VIPPRANFAFPLSPDFPCAPSSDFGALWLRGADQQIGLISRLAGAINDRRHPASVEHGLTDLLRQRIFQTACDSIDGNDANRLRRDPMPKLAIGRASLRQTNDLASGLTLSRLENGVSRQDVYRLAKGFAEAFIARYAAAPKIIALDMDRAEDATHGQQVLAFYNRPYDNRRYLPLFIFEGLSGQFVTVVRSPAKRPAGRENAAIVQRVLRLLRPLRRA
jgi:hypothetical protein